MRQFLNGRQIGPIGMSEEKDEATMAEEQARLEAGHHDGGVEEIEGVPPQVTATPGMPERKAAARRQARVRENLHLLPKNAQEAILESFENDKAAHNPAHRHGDTRTTVVVTSALAEQASTRASSSRFDLFGSSID